MTDSVGLERLDVALDADIAQPGRKRRWVAFEL
jgi:hypothetical protein